MSEDTTARIPRAPAEAIKRVADAYNRTRLTPRVATCSSGGCGIFNGAIT